MKNPVIRGAVLVFVLGGAYFAGRYQVLSSSPDSPTQAGYVGFEPGRVDLGDHLWGTVLPLELTFVNEGLGPVVIESVTSTCDCVVFDEETYHGQSVEPDGLLVLPMRLDTGLYPGLKHRIVKVVGASGGEYTAELFVNVHGTWSLEPDTLDFAEVLLGDPSAPDAEQTLTFVSETDELVGNPEVNVPWLRCFAAQRDTDTTEILVRVMKDELAPGVSTPNIVFRTTSSVRPDTAVYVRVNAMPALVGTPSNVFLVGGEAKRVRFADRDARPVCLVRAEASSADIRATIVAPDQVEFPKAREGPLATPVTVRVQDVKGRFTTVVVSVF
ncbi:MAG: DUF1573 domain-containing protein [Phycisphaerae bacterium]